MCNRIFFQQYLKLQVLYQHQDTIVYLTQHVKLLNLCVIKQINKGSSYFYHGIMEAKVLQSLHHPGIPQYYKQYETEEAIFLVEEYKEGESLYSICQLEQLSYPSILSYGIQLCDILHYLHSQPYPILHLDLNPNNIIIHKGRLSLIDFSAAIYLESKKYDGQRFGTLGYAAPEQYNQKPLDQRTDMFAFGKVLEAMLATVKKEEASKKLCIIIEKIIKRCTQYHKIRRYQSIQQVGSLLSKFYQEESYGPKEELDFVVAGTQSRIGTTHIALLFSTYLKRLHGSCLYVEKNQSGHAALLIQQNRKLGDAGFYEYEQIPIQLFSNQEAEEAKGKHFTCTVSDYGVLSHENVQEFMKHKNRILIFGGKAYEEGFVMNCLKLLPSVADIYFLGNFMSKQDLVTSKLQLISKRVYCLPYEPSMKLSKECEMLSVFSKIARGDRDEV